MRSIKPRWSDTASTPRFNGMWFFKEAAPRVISDCNKDMSAEELGCDCESSIMDEEKPRYPSLLSFKND